MEQELEITTDKTRINLEFVHNYLSNQSYWAKGRSLEDVQLSIDNSLCFSLLDKKRNVQIGFARVATDYVVFAWLMDVFIDEQFKGKGYGKMLVDSILNYPKLNNVNGFGLRTSDAHGLYGKFGFSEIPEPKTWMYKKMDK